MAKARASTKLKKSYKKRIKEYGYQKIESHLEIRFPIQAGGLMFYADDNYNNAIDLATIMQNSIKWANFRNLYSEYKVVGLSIKLMMGKHVVAHNRPTTNGCIAFYPGLSNLDDVGGRTYANAITCNHVLHFTGNETDVKTKYLNLKGKLANTWYTSRAQFNFYAVIASNHESTAAEGYGGDVVFTFYLVGKNKII